MAALSGARPNIVFICSDQHAFRYTGYVGHPIVKTPNMDRIAEHGVVFTNKRLYLPTKKGVVAMTIPKVPPYLSVVNPAEWAFILLKRTRAARCIIPQAYRPRNRNWPVFVAYDDSDLFA